MSKSKSAEFLLTVGKRRLKSKIGSAADAALCLFIVALCVAPVHAEEADAPERVAASVPAAGEEAACVKADTVLCLHGGGEEVKVDFTANGETLHARVARPRTDDSGLFYFFEPNNWEMLLKVLDGCGVNQHHWVFAATASDVGIELVVRGTTLPDQDADGGMVINSRTYTFDPIVRRPQGPNESDEGYLAEGHLALTEVRRVPRRLRQRLRADSSAWKRDSRRSDRVGRSVGPTSGHRR